MNLAPIRPEFSSDTVLLSLCVWREARGECYEAKLGVVWTVRNRMAIAPREGFAHDIRGNVLKPWAFSSFMAGDPNALKYPPETARSWKESQRAVSEGMKSDQDPTCGAVFYFSDPIKSPPQSWGKVQISAVIGGLTFCKIEDKNVTS
jgi:spore germination cell wall hydrolase CwlJ-like protein